MQTAGKYVLQDEECSESSMVRTIDECRKAKADLYPGGSAGEVERSPYIQQGCFQLETDIGFDWYFNPSQTQSYAQDLKPYHRKLFVCKVVTPVEHSSKSDGESSKGLRQKYLCGMAFRVYVAYI